MDSQIIFNLIAHFLLDIKMDNVNIINCWSIEDRFDFTNLMRNHLIFVRNIRILPAENYQKDIENICSYGTGAREGFVFDYSCPESLRVLEQISQLRCFTMARYWLVFETKTNNFIEHIENKNLSVDAHLTYAKSIETPSTQTSVHHWALFQLYDIYNNGKMHGGNLNVTYDRSLNCTNDSKLVVSQSLPKLCRIINQSDLRLISFFRNRPSLKDLTMRVETVITTLDINQPEEVLFDFLNSMTDLHIDNVPRYGFRLTLILRDMLGYKIKWYHSRIWTQNFTSGGVLGDIESERVDQCISSFILFQERLTHVRIVFVTSKFQSAFLFRTPPIADLSGTRFLRPFNLTVWICTVAMIVVFGIGWKKIISVERFLKKDTPFIPSYLTTILDCFGMLCQQGGFLMLNSTGGRISFVILLISCYLLYNYYTSLIVAFLLGSPPSSDIKTLKHLADSDMVLGMENTPYTKTYLGSKVPDVAYFVRKKIETLKDAQSIWTESRDGILKTRKPGYAYHCDVSIGYIFIERYYQLHEICDLNEVGLIGMKPLGVLIKKNSPFHDMYATRYAWMAETGIMSKHRRFWIKKRPECLAQNVIESISIEYAAPVFLVLIIGMMTSVFILIIEIISHKLLENVGQLHL